MGPAETRTVNQINEWMALWEVDGEYCVIDFSAAAASSQAPLLSFWRHGHTWRVSRRFAAPSARFMSGQQTEKQQQPHEWWTALFIVSTHIQFSWISKHRHTNVYWLYWNNVVYIPCRKYTYLIVKETWGKGCFSNFINSDTIQPPHTPIFTDFPMENLINIHALTQ